jgi:fatty acid desaturase
MSVRLSPEVDTGFKNPLFQRRVNALRRLDNWTNWFYLAREYLFLGVVLGLTVAFYHYRADWALSWFWNLPVTVAAVVLVGVGQHRLAMLAHEASHYMLFRNRVLNELVSDWFCLYPLYGTTQQYRLQHLAHHQYVNDRERDPDLAQLEWSGQRFRFPMTAAAFLWACVVKQVLWPPGLLRYLVARSRYTVTGAGGPYTARGRPSRILMRLGSLYVAAFLGVALGLPLLHRPWLLALVPVGLWAGAVAFYALVPERCYSHYVVKPQVAMRWNSCLRVTHVAVVYTTLAWLTYLSGEPGVLYYVLLWGVPVATAFSYFMLLREVTQHGNADRGRLTNTRIFRVAFLVRWAVFPLGMDYHLPHHLFPMIPHYRLKELHALLQECAEYRRQATVVGSYFFAGGEPGARVTMLDVVGRPVPGTEGCEGSS